MNNACADYLSIWWYNPPPDGPSVWKGLSAQSKSISFIEFAHSVHATMSQTTVDKSPNEFLYTGYKEQVQYASCPLTTFVDYLRFNPMVDYFSVGCDNQVDCELLDVISYLLQCGAKPGTLDLIRLSTRTPFPRLKVCPVPRRWFRRSTFSPVVLQLLPHAKFHPLRETPCRLCVSFFREGWRHSPKRAQF